MDADVLSKDKDVSDGLTPVADVNLKERFATLLAAKGWKQQDLADNLGVDKAYISRIVNGHQTPPLDVRRRIADLLDTDSGVIWRLEDYE